MRRDGVVSLGVEVVLRFVRDVGTCWKSLIESECVRQVAELNSQLVVLRLETETEYKLVYWVVASPQYQHDSKEVGIQLTELAGIWPPDVPW